MHSGNDLTVGQWFITILLMCIPIVNIVLLIVWAVSDETNPRRNYARAYLIWVVIGIVAGVIAGFAGCAASMTGLM